MSEFTDKHRQRFRRLLEVAHSTTFDGEREAALGAATRLADTYGMTLREAAGMAEAAEPKPKPAAPRRPAKPKANEWTGAVHAQKFQEALHPRHKNDGPTPPKFESEMDGIIADKKRFEKAMQDAIGRADGRDGSFGAQKNITTLAPTRRIYSRVAERNPDDRARNRCHGRRAD